MRSAFPLLITAVVCLQTCCLFAFPADTTLQPCRPCADMANYPLPDVTIESVEEREAPVAHCMISGRIGREIEFELALPQAWNGRFSFSGNGGFAGSIQTSHHRIRQGYANAATNTGHRGDALDGSWALHQLERQVNFGYLAVHRTTVTAKALLAHYYGRPARYSYFVGCSRGGGQGMMAAQRYPEDFDGIVAGAPAFAWTAFAAEFVQNAQALFGSLKPGQPRLLDSLHLQHLEQAILAQCDALDGLEDGILNDPRQCEVDLSTLPACSESRPQDLCFSPAQKKAIHTVYAGTSIEGKQVHPGFPYGGENHPRGWPTWITGKGPLEKPMSLHKSFAENLFKYFVFQDSSWDYRTYDFANFFQETAAVAATLDATNPDYSPFIERNGKMLLYHGWSDPALSALATIEHYEQAREVNQNLPDHLRLFLLPGVMHCHGGPGPSQADWLAYLRAWVEEGTAPEAIIVRKKRPGTTPMTRPVYPYPDVATYKGEGDPDQAGSFERRPGR